ncbi:hypothetical protein CI109_104561 [Kwoniella shandongensis]|uniref:Uncharacterized protein n=1 Tax=Kwoniella shandongensis TaxID=1734106 RepID=A0A5M6BXF8_9TREE|nr:uncharacterized protein CI109_005549 [Kwoniella shandongensis]KAA5526115.1 hypothetical protein CI109_005549 [Kwoniella shandongensis]
MSQRPVADLDSFVPHPDPNGSVQCWVKATSTVSGGSWNDPNLPNASDGPLQSGSTFHPDFSIGGDTILEANDGVAFRVAFGSITEASPEWFGRLERDPSIKETPRILLASVTSNALSMILCSFFKPKQAAVFTQNEIGEHFWEAYQASKKYDSTTFLDIFISNHSTASPFIRYTLAAIHDDLPAARTASRGTLRQSLTEFSPILEKLLREQAPSYYRRLMELHRARAQAFERILTGLPNLYTDLRVNIKFEGFGTKCKRRYGQGCPAYKHSEGRFGRVMKDAAIAVHRVCVADRITHMCPVVEDAIYDAVRCETCANRLINGYEAGLRKIFEHLPDCI